MIFSIYNRFILTKHHHKLEGSVQRILINFAPGWVWTVVLIGKFPINSEISEQMLKIQPIKATGLKQAKYQDIEQMDLGRV